MNKQRTILLSLLLAAVTLALFLPATTFDFIRYDDPRYVSQNPNIRDGVTWKGVEWAFGNGYAGNWHPLTWLSHMLDRQLYGAKPWGHHLTNVIFHTANSVLLFLILLGMTKSPWRSFLVAAFFAWHPLHVESVAWVAERKDVLSAFFWMIALGAYTKYATTSQARWYGLTLLSFVLGLLSKPMVVSLPFVLLLLDFWPLKRARSISSGGTKNIATLLLEKLPFFILSLGSSIVTIWAQQKDHAVASMEKIPLGLRFGHAFIAYIEYLGKTFWPDNLAVFYPYTATLPPLELVFALMVLGGLSAWAVIKARKFPWLVTGWFWFLGTLVPVIGIVQVGQQAMADRYSYLPSIGLFMALVWMAAELSAQSKAWRTGFGVGAGGLLAACLVMTSIQLRYWKDTVTLFEHARNVTSGNYLADGILGAEFADAGKTDEAIDAYNQALNYNPNFAEGHYSLARVYLSRGDMDLATLHFRDATRLNPDLAEAFNGLGFALASQGNLDEAIAEYRHSLQLRPQQASANLNLANALLAQGKLGEAAAFYEKTLSLEPLQQEAHSKLGAALNGLGRYDGALPHLLEAIRLKPDDAVAHFQAGAAYTAQNNLTEAIRHYENAIQITPDWPEALNNLAWIRAAAGNPQFRNGTEAVKLAKRACALTGDKQPLLLGTLAAAYAEAGDFTNAVATARKARDLALAANQKSVAAKNEELLHLYESNQAYHEPVK